MTNDSFYPDVNNLPDSDNCNEIVKTIESLTMVTVAVLGFITAVNKVLTEVRKTQKELNEFKSFRN